MTVAGRASLFRQYATMAEIREALIGGEAGFVTWVDGVLFSAMAFTVPQSVSRWNWLQYCTMENSRAPPMPKANIQNASEKIMSGSRFTCRAPPVRMALRW